MVTALDYWTQFSQVFWLMDVALKMHVGLVSCNSTTYEILYMKLKLFSSAWSILTHSGLEIL